MLNLKVMKTHLIVGLVKKISLHKIIKSIYFTESYSHKEKNK